MKAKLKTIIFAVIMLGIMGISSKVQAAGASISSTKTTATVGDSVTITVNINAAAWNLKVNGNGVSGGSIVGYNPEGINTSTTKTYALNTSSAGTYTIKLTGDVTDGSTDVTSDINTSVTVTVNNPAPVTPTNPPSSNNGGSTNNGSSSTGNSNSGSSNSGSSNSGSSNKPSNTTKPEEPKSNDSTLKGLAIEGYELYPAFDANTREYNLRVTNDITKVTVLPTVNHSKASYKIEGATEELVVGKNVITIVVTAEDGTTSNYVINVTREREGLKVQYIKIYYTDETGNRQELLLNPEFSAEIFEYTLKDLSYLISKLDVEVLANLEQAKIEVTGNEELVEGPNTIVITVTMPSESEEEEDEVLTYKITVNKEKEPVVTLMGRIKNWFNGITGSVSTWFGENVYEILMGALVVSCVALAGLSVYLVMDYKKYKMIIEKVAEITRINNATTVNAGESTNTNETTNQQILEEMQNNEEEIEIKNRGKHF
ncbi:MAG: cadherin-like beta sandwich domain-containing protein [Clostridia bacterium]|nr:cadherin-like beta sandwich domain-containing protein [Clostridia bacterium]